MILFLRKAWAWLSTHTAVLCTALGALVAFVLLRRRSTSISKADVDIATRVARAESATQRARELEPVAERLRQDIATDEAKLKAVEQQPGKVRDESDSDVADRFSDYGL